MYGSSSFKFVNGSWDVVGYLKTTNLLIPDGVTIPKGTWLSEDPESSEVDKEALYASGFGLGLTTQDITNEGQRSLEAYRDTMIGKTDLPISKGQPVTLRVPRPGSEMEFEGLGDAEPGNLVCTNGTGALSDSDDALTELSFHNGCIRKAQENDLVQLHLLKADIEPEVEGRLRIRVRAVGGYIKGA